MISPIDRVLSALPSARETNGGWSARCPAHDDRRASLSIGTGEDGRVLLHCHAGCSAEAVVRKLGLTMRDLMPSGNGKLKKSKLQIVETYNYNDADGKLLYQVCRVQPKSFFQRAPKRGGGWTPSVKGVKRVPYRLPELLAADSAQTIFIVEGEKDADRLFGFGLTATTNAGGVGKWSKDFAEYFSARSVAILPDNDAPGRAHARDVASKLFGAAVSIKIIELPGLAEKQDVSDWLDAGHSVDELQALVNAAQPWEPSADTPDHSPPSEICKTTKTDRLLKIIRFGLNKKSFVGAIQYGQVNSAYDLLFEEGDKKISVRIGSTEKLLSKKFVSARLLETLKHNMIRKKKKVTAKTWPRYARAIVELAETRPGLSETDTIEDRVRSYLKSEIESRGIVRFDPKTVVTQEGADGKPWPRCPDTFHGTDKKLYLKLTALETWLAFRHLKIDSKSLTAGLQAIGFKPTKLRATDSHGRRWEGRFWIHNHWDCETQWSDGTGDTI